jgi:hypothetical protein
MQDKAKIERSLGPSFAGGEAAAGTGRVNVRDIMRRKMIRKMTARRARHPEMTSPLLFRRDS